MSKITAEKALLLAQLHKETFKQIPTDLINDKIIPNLYLYIEQEAKKGRTDLIVSGNVIVNRYELQAYTPDTVHSLFSQILKALSDSGFKTGRMAGSNDIVIDWSK